MIGAPFESWDAVAGASYYTGLGGGELIWLIISIVLCVLAILVSTFWFKPSDLQSE